MPLILNTWYFWAVLAALVFLWTFRYWVALCIRRLLIRRSEISALEALIFLFKKSRFARAHIDQEKQLAILLSDIAPVLGFDKEKDKLMQAASEDKIVLRGKCSSTGIIKRIPINKFDDFTLAFRRTGEELSGILCPPEYQVKVHNDSFFDDWEGGCSDLTVDVVSLKAGMSRFWIMRLMYRMLDARRESGQG